MTSTDIADHAGIRWEDARPPCARRARVTESNLARIAELTLAVVRDGRLEVTGFAPTSSGPLAFVSRAGIGGWVLDFEDRQLSRYGLVSERAGVCWAPGANLPGAEPAAPAPVPPAADADSDPAAQGPNRSAAIWRLRVTTFMSIGSIGAEHYYGKLSARGGLLSGDVEHILTVEAAARLSRKERDFTWRPGTASGRFDAPELVEAAGIAIARDLGRPDDIVLLERGSTGEPARCLAGPDDAVRQLNELHDAWSALDIEQRRKGAPRIGADWDALAAAEDAWEARLVELGYADPRRTLFGYGDGSETFQRRVVYGPDGAAIDRVIEGDLYDWDAG